MSQETTPRIPARPSGEGGSPLGALRRFVRPREPLEQCEVCGEAIPPDPNHPHLLDMGNRQVVCVCTACALTIGGEHTSGRRYRVIPERIQALPDFQMTDAIWDGVLIPVGMAFFFFNSADEKMMAYYPSPAGATESLLSPDAWETIIEANPTLAQMEPDVEALLVNRVRGAHDYYRVPIDECYRLVGLVRMYWQGLSGGTEVWEEISKFFAALTRRAASDGRASHA